MARLIALKKLPYKGRRLSFGDEFDVSCVKTRRVLIALGKAKLADDCSVMEFLDPEFPEVTTTTEPPVVVEEPIKPKRKRTYRRKDIKAEDDQEIS